LRFFHTLTGERLDVVYRRGTSYVSEGLAKLDFLGGHRTGVHHYDPKVFDLLSEVTAGVGRQLRSALTAASPADRI